MRSGERGGAGKKSGYYPAENDGIDKTRVAITADRTNTMIASERNFFFSPRFETPVPPPLPPPPPPPRPPSARRVHSPFFFPTLYHHPPTSAPPPPLCHPFRASLLQNSPFAGIKVGVISGERSKGVEKGWINRRRPLMEQRNAYVMFN